MTLDWNFIVVSLAFSAVGFVYFSYGKKQAKIPMMLCGLSLMVYTYFVDSIMWSILIGILLSVTPLLFR